MTLRVAVPTDFFGWARERSRIPHRELLERFSALEAWESGVRKPTIRQLEDFAKATATPIGYFFLEAPPVETVPIPDFRTLGDDEIQRPSTDLLDTIYQCQQRQEWYRSYMRVQGRDQVPFVGSLTMQTEPSDAADVIRDALGLDETPVGRGRAQAFSDLVQRAEDVGVLVMVNGVVGNNTRRKLDPNEFRGFALVDSWAPTVFVNGADTKAAQIFTLMHELAHLWLGESGLDNPALGRRAADANERWCNRAAADVLVPLRDFRMRYRPDGDLTSELDRLAALYSVSTLVVLRRIHEAGFLNWEQFRQEYERERARVLDLIEERAGGGGGNFYNTLPLRVSRSFAKALVADALEGRTTYTTAMRMLGIRKMSTFDKFATHLAE